MVTTINQQNNHHYIPMVINYYFQGTLQSPLESKKIKPVQPKGNLSWVFIGRTDAEAETPLLWPPDVKNWLITN